MQGVNWFEQSDILKIEQSLDKHELSHTIKNRGIVNDTVSTLIVELYQIATLNSFSVKQKYIVINLTISILKALIQTKTKEQLVINIEKELQKLGRRNQHCKLIFNQAELQLLSQFYSQKVVAYYELYQIVLDQNPHFKFEAKELNLVKQITQKGLQQGLAIQVDNIALLKEFLGIRAAKQEKKDPKKK